MLYSYKTVGNKSLVGGGVVEKGIPPTATNYWGLSSNNKNLRAQANMNPTTTTTTTATNVVKTKNVLVVSTLTETGGGPPVTWTGLSELQKIDIIEGVKNATSTLFGVPKSKISVTGRDGSIIVDIVITDVPDDVDVPEEDINTEVGAAAEGTGIFNSVNVTTEEYDVPNTHIFTQRGWTFGTSYDPSAGTLFYAVDLYSNDASRNSALVLYGIPNTWQFEYTNPVESINDFSYLFNSSADAARPSHVSGFNFDIGDWDVNGVTNMESMFEDASFNQYIGNWNVSNVTTMEVMFKNSKFNQDINGWNVSKVTNMDSMFVGSTFNQNISSWDTGKVKFMNSMFKDTSFNQDIGNWDVSAVENMTQMFRNTPFNKDISNWNVSKVTNMQAMFYGTYNFNQDISGWNVSNVITMEDMFRNATNMSQNISVWDTSTNALPGYNRNFTSIFVNSAMASVLNINDVSGGDNATQTALGDTTAGSWFTGPFTPYTFTSRGWSNTDATYAPAADTLFYAVDLYSNDASRNEAILAYGIINTWQFDYTANGGDLKDFSDLFNYDADPGLQTGRQHVSGFNFDIGSWDVSGVTDMNNMFRTATSFNQPIGDWNVGKVIRFTNTFQGAHSFNQDISGWNVSEVTDMTEMFSSARVFNQPIGNWNVSNVTNMSLMFEQAFDFDQSLNDWNVGNVSTMAGMFSNANSFNQPIGNWNVSNVTNMSLMFYVATSFNQDISGWNVSNVTTFENMFWDAYDMSQNIWVWDTSTNAIPGYNRTFSNMFRTSSMAGVLNANDVSGGNNATQTALGITTAGSWFIKPYTFTSRGWSNTDATYAPAADTLFYAVDLYSNDASRNEAKALYNNINTWQFDYTANGGDLKDFSELFYYYPVNSNGDRPTDVSGFNFDIDNWDVSGVTRMDSMFRDAANFDQSLNDWNVSGVTSMREMFRNATSFNQNIGSWNVSKVNNMQQMFRNNRLFNQDIGPWNVGSVTTMYQMFNGAYAFNQDISGWDVSGVISFEQMFQGALDMSQNIWAWDVCGNATFTSIFVNSDMSGVLNADDVSGGNNADAGTGNGSWFLGP